MKTISLKVDEALDQWLETEAKKLGRTKSEIAREALEFSRQRQGDSLHDLMKDFCGKIKNAPADLSSNKKHMKGFGRDKRHR